MSISYDRNPYTMSTSINLFTRPPATSRCGTRSIFNLNFSYSSGYLINAREVSLSFYLPVLEWWGENRWIIFPNDIEMQSCPRLELGSPIPFPTTITVTISAHSYVCSYTLSTTNRVHHKVCFFFTKYN